MLEEYLRNEQFREIIDTGHYIYADGHICLNEPQYVVRQGKKLCLTEWANAHVDQCCLRFVRTYHRDRRTHYVFGRLNSDEAYNGRSLALSIQNGAEDALQQAQEISRVLLDLPGSFSGTLIAHMKRTGITREKLTEESMMSDTTIKRIRKTFVENDGNEIPKYYAENSHPAIISAEVFDLTQMEIAWRRSLSGHYSGKSCFSSRVVCGECGAFYGSKVWHSTDEYRRVIWRCNGKYEGDKKYSTPYVTQDELEKGFVAAMQELIVQKETVFAACRAAIAETLDTAELDRTAAKLENQTLGMAERMRKLVEENARVQRDQEEYRQEYNALATEHEKLSEKIRAIAEQKRDKEKRRRKIEIFLQMLDEQNEYVRFESYTFVSLVDRVVVWQNGELEFIFRNGMKYKIT